MSYFTTARAAKKRNLAHRKWREVIVKHEPLLGFAFENFQALHIVTRAERGSDKSLCFAPGENCGTMGARENSNFAPDLANLIERTPIGTPLVVDNLLAEDAFPQSLVVSLQLCAAFFIVLRERRHQFLLEILNQRIAFSFRMFLSIETVGEIRTNLFMQLVIVALIEFGRRNSALLLPNFLF